MTFARLICRSKIPFTRKDDALRHVRNQRRISRGGAKLRAYRCPSCGCWHLSSRSYRRQAAERGAK